MVKKRLQLLLHKMVELQYVFVIDGVQKPTLIRTGTKYIFDQSDGTNATPIKI